MSDETTVYQTGRGTDQFGPDGKPLQAPPVPDVGSIFHQLPTALIVVDRNRVVQRWNRAAQTVFRRDPADVIGQRYDVVLPFLRELGMEKHLARVLTNGQSVNMLETPLNLERALSGDEFWYDEDSTAIRSRTGRLLTPGRAPDGTPLDYLDLLVDPLKNDAGQVVAALITVRDSTERALLRLNFGLKTELLEMIYQVSNALRSTGPMDAALFIILSALTARQGGAFDRAMLFLVDEMETNATGWMGMGSLELFDVWSMWRGLTDERAHLDDVLREAAPDVLAEMHALTEKVRELGIRTTGNGVVATAIRTRTTFSESTLPPDCQLEPELEAMGIKHYVAVPLVAHRRVDGLLLLDYSAQPPALTTDWLGMLEMYAHQAALAIENARAFNRAVQESQSDSLTGLANHGHFQQTLARAVAQAVRYPHPLSLIMLDIDHFKKLNDHWGHPTGDKVLVELARLLRRTTREVDTCARYGGEEFAVILPHTGLEEAARLAERLRQRVKDELRVPAGDASATVVATSASFGVASCPADATDAEGLIRAADAALYRAKQLGRNRVELSENVDGDGAIE
ncbi:MAG: diguanylate cyclase [Planctomycetota bacterium]